MPPLTFDFDRIRHFEFGVGLKLDEEHEDKNGKKKPNGKKRKVNYGEKKTLDFYRVKVDEEVKAELLNMVMTTWDNMQLSKWTGGKVTKTNRKTAVEAGEMEPPRRYQPSEKYSSSEHVYIPLDAIQAVHLKQLHEADGIPIDKGALKKHARISVYFVRMEDQDTNRLTAVRRATRFKGILKARLIQLISESMEIVCEPVFQLDQDFDLLADASRAHILRPQAFALAFKLQEFIMRAVPKNIKIIEKAMPPIDFEPIRAYAVEHPRAAGFVSSIAAQVAGPQPPPDLTALKAFCEVNGVKVNLVEESIIPEKGHELGFLEVLDDRRYAVTWPPGGARRYRATGRERV
ncbi:MAG: hypothetical protein OEV49_17755 [candidate division Zixibacteria bacterium]|nr:hypothetical protein [candidate division Zixibacteria bacterium]MDH3938963.1 hypothetical protein [candidate division Zixibacteria bacterium]MDH4034254.1 hypothetical protein [candidate division Zixibacteria bacterium]